MNRPPLPFTTAVEITGRSHSYLKQQAAAGALAGYRRGQATGYWLTTAEAAARLGIARQNAHRARLAGRLPAQRASNGDWLVRRDDVLALLVAAEFTGPVTPVGSARPGTTQ